MATLHSTVRVAPDVLFNELDGEAVVLNLTTGKYFGLNEVGTRMWALLAVHATVDVVYRSLLAEYDVSADSLQHDLVKLVDDLAGQGLVSIVP